MPATAASPQGYERLAVCVLVPLVIDIIESVVASDAVGRQRPSPIDAVVDQYRPLLAWGDVRPRQASQQSRRGTCEVLRVRARLMLPAQDSLSLQASASQRLPEC